MALMATPSSRCRSKSRHVGQLREGVSVRIFIRRSRSGTRGKGRACRERGRTPLDEVIRLNSEMTAKTGSTMGRGQKADHRQIGTAEDRTKTNVTL